MYIKNRVPFRPNKAKNYYLKFIDCFYISNVVVELTPFLNTKWKQLTFNTLILAGISLILFCVVGRITYAPSLSLLR